MAGCYQKLFFKKIQELPAWPEVGVADRCCSSTGSKEITGVAPVKPLSQESFVLPEKMSSRVMPLTGKGKKSRSA